MSNDVRRRIRPLPTRYSGRRHCLFLTIFAVFIGWSLSAVAEEDATQGVNEGSITDNGALTIATADEELRLEITGRFQLRYQFESARQQPDRSSIYLRRIQPNIEGSALSEDLTFRLRPDISRSATLRDAFVSYRIRDGFQLRGGQFNVPFSKERNLPPVRHQFLERSAANDEFQPTDGRDIGVMVHGEPAEGLHYGVGVFNGEGRNQARSDSTGHLISGRLVYALLGEYKTSEVTIEPVDDISVALGAGGFAALDNNSRDWTLSGDFDTAEADVFAATADAQLLWSRISMHLGGFFRHVDPGVAIPPIEVEVPPGGDVIEALPSFQGFGWSAHLGGLLISERLFASLRYGQVDAHRDDELRRHEATAGLQIFHRGHHSKFHVESGVEFDENADDWPDLFLARLQYQFLF